MSQFTIYSSGDASAPTLNGTVGTLLNVLDGCLVNGYGSKAGAGWTKPFANSGNIGCYKLGTGSMMNLSVNDNGPGAGGAKEARVTGWEFLSSVSTGTGSFPTSAQGVGGVAMVVARKSATATTTTRDWIVVADSSSMYMFVKTGDNVNNYLCWSFGDFYSISSNPDLYRCMIVGRTTENNATVTTDKLDNLSANMTTALAGHFVARNFGGTGTSITVNKHGDGVKGSTSTLLGTVSYPNSCDDGIYVSPVWIVENSTSVIRGRMRGFYHILHAITNFTDLQSLSGSGDYFGKTFLLIRLGGSGGVFCIETSNTLETN